MTNKPKFLKNLLMTTSALAVIASGVTSASATQMTTNGAATAHVGARLGFAGAHDFVNGDSILFGGAHTLTTGGPVTIGAIDANNVVAGRFTVAHATSLGSVINTGGVQKMAVTVTDATALTITGTPGLKAGNIVGNVNDYTALGAITLGTAGAGDATLNFALAGAGAGAVKTTTIRDKIDGDAAGAGVVNVAAYNNIVFADSIGNGQAIHSLVLAANGQATLSGAVNKFSGAVAGGILFTANTSVLTVANGANITMVNGGNESDIDGVGGVNGTLTFLGNSTVDTEDGIGRANGLTAINIGAGVVELSGNTALVKATNVNFTDAASVLKLSNAVDITGNIVNTSGVNKQGAIVINGADQVINGTIGTNAATGSIAAIKFNSDHTLTVIATDASIYADSIVGVGAAARGKLEVQGDTASLFNISTGANKLTSVTLMSNKAAGAAGAFTLKDGSTVHATSLDLAGAAFNNTLTLENNTTIDANVTTSKANNGILIVKGDSTITGTIGAGAAISAINFDAASAGKTLTVGGNAVTLNAANSVNFAANATLALTNTGNTTLTGDANTTVTLAATNTGTITSAVTTGNALRINGGIGAIAAGAGVALKSISATAGGNVVLTGGNANVQQIVLSSTGTPSLTLDAKTYQIGSLNAGTNNVKIIVNGNATLAKGTSLFNSVNGVATTNSSIDTVSLGANTLTLDDTVNYTANGGTIHGTAAVANTGTLTFLGSSTIGGNVGADGDAINTINISGAADKAVVFQNNVYANGAITFKAAGANSSVSFGGHVTANGGIVSNANNVGDVIFNNTTEADVKSKIGVVGTGFNNVKIIGTGNVNLLTANAADGLNTKALTFAAGSGNLTIDTDLGATNVTTAAGSTNKIFVTEDQNLTGTIGAGIGIVIGSHKTPIVVSDKTVTVGKADFVGSITTLTDNKGAVITGVDGIKFTALGDAANSLKLVTFANNATSANTFAQTATIAAGKTVEFAGGLRVGTATTANAGYGLTVETGSTVTLNDGIISSGSIYGDAAGNGTVDILGAGDIATLGQNAANTDANGLLAVNFKGVAGKIAKLTGDITAAKITTGAGTIDTSGADRALTGALSVDGTTFDLGAKTLTQTGDVTLTAKDVTLKSTVTDDNEGNVEIEGALKAGAKVNISVSLLDDSTKIDDMTFTVLAAKTLAAADAANINVITANGGVSKNSTFVKFTASRENNTIVVNRSDNTKAAIADIIASVPAGTIDAANVAIFGENASSATVRDFGKIDSESGHAVAAESMARLTNPVSSGTEVISDSSASATNVISGRLASITAGTGSAGSNAQLTQADSLVGVAAGDEVSASKYGAWAMPFYSQSEQKKRKGISGYKAKTSGAVIGFDVAANDRLTVGVAAAYLKTDVKQKDLLRGDKSKVDTMMFSVYGLQQLDNNMFVQAVASFGSGTVKNKSKRIESASAGGNKIASGKYDSMTYGAEVIGGYNYKANEETTLTPMLGLSYNKFTDSGYTEKGTKNQNLSIAKKSTDKFEGIIGARASMNMDVSGVLVTPEAHAFARIAFNNKAPKLDVRLDSIATPLVTKADKPSSAMYNLGTSVTAKAGMMEYGVGYDATLANKYVGHQGTLKLRVNF